MACTRTIYFTDEINEKLKEEKNVSGLIGDLLKEYYKQDQKELEEMNLDELQTRRDILKLDAEREKIQAGKTSEETRVELKATEELMQEHTRRQEEREKDRQSRHERLTGGFKESFQILFDITDEEAEKHAKEFYKKREINNGINIYEYGKRLGMKEIKQEEEEEEEEKEVLPVLVS
jgi:hypothetical protein